MKAIVFLALLTPLVAAEVGGTAWYDAGGRLVVVEGPAAQPAQEPFRPGWRQRELEREARRRDPLRWQQRRRRWSGGLSACSRFSGWSVWPVPAVGRHFGPCPGRTPRGASLIIRW